MQQRLKRLPLIFAWVLMGLVGACEAKQQSPEEGQSQGAAQQQPGLEWRTDYEAALAEAKAAKRPVIVDFTAAWCSACQQLEKETFHNPEVMRELERFVRVRLDGTDDMEPIEAMMERHKVEAFPVVAFIDGAGNIVDQPRYEDFVNAKDFLAAIKSIK